MSTQLTDAELLPNDVAVIVNVTDVVTVVDRTTDSNCLNCAAVAVRP